MELLLFSLLSLCSLSVAAVTIVSDNFRVEEKSFCPGPSAFSQSVVSVIECAAVCVSRPVCCGFVHRKESRQCLLVEGVPPNMSPVGAVAGPCRVFRRRDCRDCPPSFTKLLSAAPRRVFYISTDLIEIKNVAEFCANKGGQVAEEYPPQLLHQLTSELRKIFTPAIVGSNALGCTHTGSGRYCRASSGLMRLSNGSFWWPKQGVLFSTQVINLYETSGFNVQPPKAVYKYRTATLRFDSSTKAYSGTTMGHTIEGSKIILGMCECKFLDG